MAAINLNQFILEDVIRSLSKAHHSEKKTKKTEDKKESKKSKKEVTMGEVKVNPKEVFLNMKKKELKTVKAPKEKTKKGSFIEFGDMKQQAIGL